MIRTAKSKSLPVTARPRAQEFTTKIVSTCACAEKKSPANSATSRWSSVGNLSGEIINCVVRPQRSGSTARGAFSRPNETELSHTAGGGERGKHGERFHKIKRGLHNGQRLAQAIRWHEGSG